MAKQTDLRFSFTVAKTIDFEVVEFTLEEALSEPFRLALELAHADPALDFAALLDAPARLTIWRGGQPARYVHGQVSAFSQGETGFRRTRYRAVVEPPLARLALCSDWRIFQQQSVPEILKTVLAAHGIGDYEQSLTETHLAREYCVQAGDTDLDFVLRLAAEEGLFHRFAHSEQGCRLVHGDRLYIQGAIDGGPVRYHPAPGGDPPEPALHRFTYAEQVRTTLQTQRDYTYTHPRYHQQQQAQARGQTAAGQDYARYDYPGRYKQDAAGAPFTQNRLLGLRRDASVAQVEGDDPRLVPGVAFDLTGHPREDWNHGWRPVRMTHRGVQHASQAEESAQAQQGTHYHYTAALIPDKTEWRPAPWPRPVIAGPQMATVVGPAGEEIYCDAFGRVKVQFPWDRQGNFDDFSSCWIRVSNNWAGTGWGHLAIPRVGQEVVVDFLDGDPDQPLITGRTYRVTNHPPYELPLHKTRMTIKSKTHKGEGYNELRFEDEMDQEEIYVHAQKDQNIHVNHDETTFIGHDRKEEVEHDESISIGHDRSETVGEDEAVAIGKNRSHTIGQDDTLAVERNRTITIGKDRVETVGNHRKDQTTANHLIEVGGHVEQTVQGHHKLSAGQKMERQTQVYQLQTAERMVIKGPGGAITIDGGGVTIEGIAIRLKGPTSQSNGKGNSLSFSGSPAPGLPDCVEKNR